MTGDKLSEEIVFAGRATICEYVVSRRFKMMRFTGPIHIRDWEFVCDLYGFLKTIQGPCVVDLSLVPDFDSTLYAIFIWMRILSAGRGVRFLVVANEAIEPRLRAGGVGKWLPIIRDVSVFERMLAGRDTNAVAPQSPPPPQRVDPGYSSRSVG